jgi:thioredoxin 1
MAVLEITDLNVKKTLESYIQSKQTILVDFYASWCGPCKILDPELGKLSGVIVLKINGDHPDGMVQVTVNEIMSIYDISAFPTVLVFKQGQLVQKVVGANLKAIQAAL